VTATHFIRLDPEVFRFVTVGQQHALVLPRERGVELGDHVVMREWRKPPAGTGGDGQATGLWLVRKVTFVQEGGAGTGIEPTHAVCSFNSAVENEFASISLKRQLSLAERQGVSPDRFWRVLERKQCARREVLRPALPDETA
jgi:hypothetical protein